MDTHICPFEVSVIEVIDRSRKKSEEKTSHFIRFIVLDRTTQISRQYV